MISKNDDYGYIQQFIEFLQQIIDMITKLFSGMSSNADSKDDTAADKTEE